MVKIRNCTPKEFKDIICGRKLVCICAGEGFYGFIESYHDTEYELKLILDNKLAGETVTILEKNYRILNVEQVNNEIQDSVVVITSSKYAEEIVRQLDGIRAFEGVTVYIPELFEYDESPFLFKKERGVLIPKIIHYCWFGKSPIPDRFLRNIDTWEKKLPGYDIKCWNEDNYDIEKCRFMKQAYEKKKYGFVPDYARLDIVYSYGGIYLDVDVEVLRSWNDLLYYPLFCGYENEQYVAFGLGFGAKKGNKILKEMMDDYQEMDFIDESSGVRKPIPSPIHQTRIMKKHGLLCDGQSRDYGDFLALSPMYFAPINLEAGIRRPKSESFSIHQYAGTWLDEDDNIKKDSAIRKYSFLMKHIIEDGE